MLLAGAKRHAKEVIELFYLQGNNAAIVFFDDISSSTELLIFDKYQVIKSLPEAQKYFETINNKFVLALGNPIHRKILAEKLIGIGGEMDSIIAPTSAIGHFEVNLGKGLNIMHYAMISNCVQIGTGTLVNAFTSIHHDVIIGNYCELSPHSVILGGCTVGDFTSIGANATLLPNIIVGKNVIVGAGAVVTKNLPDNVVVAGVPAKIISRTI